MELVPGQNYFVRTVTDYWLGELVSVDGPYTITLVDFTWIASTGRLHIFLRNGTAPNLEAEPAPDGMKKMVQWLSIDEWPHPLIRKVQPNDSAK